MCKNLKRHYIHGMTNILVLWEMQPLVETSDIFFQKTLKQLASNLPFTEMALFSETKEKVSNIFSDIWFYKESNLKSVPFYLPFCLKMRLLK